MRTTWHNDHNVCKLQKLFSFVNNSTFLEVILLKNESAGRLVDYVGALFLA